MVYFPEMERERVALLESAENDFDAARACHVVAEDLREHEEDLYGSIKAALDAAVLAEQENDSYRAGEAYASVALAYARLWKERADPVHLSEAMHYARMGVERLGLTERSKAVPLLTLAKMEEYTAGLSADTQTLALAVEHYGEALDAQRLSPHPTQTWGGITLMIAAKYETASFKLSKGRDASALSNAHAAIAQLEAIQPIDAAQAYNREVWLAVAHMDLAAALRPYDLDRAREHLRTAKALVAANMADPDPERRKLHHVEDDLRRLSATFVTRKRPTTFVRRADYYLRRRDTLPARIADKVCDKRGEAYFESWQKRWLVDFPIGLAGTIFTAPLVIYFCARVWIEDGRPVLYRDIRLGKCGELVKVTKIRSMRKGADKLPQEEIARINHELGPAADPRNLEVGKTMRRWEFDEMPQFWAMLRGKLSAVGIRIIQQQCRDSMARVLDPRDMDRWDRAYQRNRGVGNSNAFRRKHRKDDTKRIHDNLTDDREASVGHDYYVWIMTTLTTLEQMKESFDKRQKDGFV